ncbi:universal stress protein [Pseudarthrobacter sp. YS3]|uniref:universal stress protein n=1 Tax=Pseudarthrobacter sp. YS3 TaxID=3453718 RepID=UPI003EEA1776
MSRGNLRIFPGAAPGEGKTLALLDEGRRLAAGGADVVVGAADVGPEAGQGGGTGAGSGDVGGGLEWCPPPGAVRGTGPALDVDALLSRSPGVVLVDDLAASDAGVPRWQQIERLLDAGIDVVSTLDVRSLASRPEPRALPNSSGPRNTSGAVRERVVVGISGKPDDEALIRRGAQVLAAAAGGELHVVHVRTAGARAVPSGKELDQLRTVTAGVGGVFHAIGGEDIPTALLRFARSVTASQLVLGTSRPLRGGRLRFLQLAAGLPGRGGTVAAVVRNAGNLDVHLVAQKAGTAERTRPRPGLGQATARLRPRRGAAAGPAVRPGTAAARPAVHRHAGPADRRHRRCTARRALAGAGGRRPGRADR